MTSNQHRAVEVARHLLSGEMSDARLSDGEWHLLLLGAGVNCQGAPLLKVAGRVLDNAERHAGYFARAEGDSTSLPNTSAPAPDFRCYPPTDAPDARPLDVRGHGEPSYARS